MDTPVDDIVFEILYEGRLNKIETHLHAYRNLMMLIRDNLFPDYFGECGGQGRCGTCTVKIISNEHELKQKLRNEASTLQKYGIDEEDIRLSCQIFIDRDLHGLTIELLENY